MPGGVGGEQIVFLFLPILLGSFFCQYCWGSFFANIAGGLFLPILLGVFFTAKESSEIVLFCVLYPTR